MRDRVVVTGGAGFIGSHLVERLLRDHEVVVIDNFSSGRELNLAHVAGADGLRIEHIDVADHASVQPLVSGARRVFHLAALADIVPSIEQPLAYHRSNVDGTISVLEAARTAGVERFVYAASSSCYGIPTEYPTPETAAIDPRYPYALTKYLGERYVLHWGQVYGMKVVSLRLFNAYGPRARTSGSYGAVFGVFLAQKLAGKPYTVVGDGTQTRDFTFVTDIVEAMVQAATADAPSRVYNVGTGTAASVNRIVELLGSENGVVHVPKRPGEPDCTLADIGLARTELGWRPSVSLEEGVQALLDDIEHWRDAPVWDEESIRTATASWFAHLSSGD